MPLPDDHQSSGSSELLSIIGPDAMEQVCQRLAGTRIYIPQNTPDESRNVEICVTFQSFLQGGSSSNVAYAQISRIYGLKQRRIRQILAKTDRICNVRT